MFSRQIGIDLGTANVIVYVRGKGIVLTEPSVVALAKEDGSNRPRIVAVGEEARLMLGRTPGTITALRPMRDGVIADYVITEYMLRYFINKVCGQVRIFQPQLMICVPSGVTSVERRAVKDAAIRAGAREAHLIEEPLAAAIGANIPISGPSGNLIIDIGGGTAEIAVIEGYLPQAASPEEIEQAVAAAIAETGATSMKEMGAVMKATMVLLSGKNPDGRTVSETVKKKLAGGS